MSKQDTGLLDVGNGRLVSYQEALEDDENLLHRATYPPQRRELIKYLSGREKDLLAIVQHHLGHGDWHIAPSREWLFGSFNVCIPVSSNQQRVAMLRFPLLHKVGERFRPGNADEKLRCEAATYLWLSRNCPSIPIPKLYGFEYHIDRKRLSFTKLDKCTLLERVLAWIRSWSASLFGASRHCSGYLKRPSPAALDRGYLLIEFVNEGRMLSSSWKHHRDSAEHTQHLYTDLARINSELSKVSFPRIGSVTLDADGNTTLSNRPLSLRIQYLENEEIPTDIARTTTYSSIESYINAMLGIHRSRLLHQPNAVDDDEDCRFQMASLTAMGALLPHFTRPRPRDERYCMTLTDLHQSNIFVDDEWRITKIIDLEWACVLPIEMIHVPYWLTGKGIDELTGADEDEFNKAAELFIDTLETHEKSRDDESETNGQMESGKCDSSLSFHMRAGLRTGKFFYHNALWSTRGIFNVFQNNILPSFSQNLADDDNFDPLLSRLYDPDAEGIVAQKINDKKRYDDRVRQTFRIDSHEDKNEMQHTGESQQSRTSSQ